MSVLHPLIQQVVSHYRVLEHLGSGGMGVVYKAEDTQLNRLVAIKFLPDALAHEAPTFERFRREARAASALNHANICTIHDIGEHEGRPFIVMEYLDGHALRKVLQSGPLGPEQLLRLGIEVADALDAAHSKGIVHRDLKPGNIIITARGHAKLLDFGLAKLNMEGLLVEGGSTITRDRLTSSGTTPGTVAYMSPEQALGRDLDARSDLFSLGVVLYEAATGKLPFPGTTSAAIFDGILNHLPIPPVQVNPSLPPELDRIIMTCLEKDRDIRYQSAAEIVADLKRLKRDTDSGKTPISAVAVRRRRLASTRWIAAAVLSLLVVAFFVISLTPRGQPTLIGSRQISRDGVPKYKVVSDGSRLYFAAGSMEPDGVAQVSVTGGETSAIHLPLMASMVNAVSADHANLLVSGTKTPDKADLRLWSVPLPAGSPRQLGDIRTSDADWSPDTSKLVYVDGRGIWLANADGTDPKQQVEVPGTPSDVHFSPDGKRLRYTLNDINRNTFSLWEIGADGSNPHPILPGWHNPAAECCGRWTADGRYYVFQVVSPTGSDIWALRDSKPWPWSKQPRPVRLTTGPLSYSYPLPSEDGKAIYSVGTLQRGELVRYDEKARQFVPVNSGVPAGEVAFSRDAQWVVWVLYPEGTLWRSRPDGSERVQLTFPPKFAFLPRWSPDGKTIAYVASEIGKPWKIFLIPSQGGTERELLPENRTEIDVDWSADGKQLVFGRLSGQSSSESINIQLYDLPTGRLSVIPGSDNLFSPRWSPDGKYIAALSSDYKLMLLFDVAAGTWTKWIHQPQGVISFPAWSKDSRYVYYSSDGEYRRAAVGQDTSELVASLKGLRSFSGRWGSWATIAPDGTPLFVRDISTHEIYALDIKWP